LEGNFVRNEESEPLQARLGIPDDKPENTAKNITRILQHEADGLGASFVCKSAQSGIGCESTIDIDLNDKSFRIFLWWLDYDDLWKMSGSKGNGFVSQGGWQLELLHGKETGPPGWDLHDPSPPFRWGLYPRNSDVRRSKPTHILDGTLLRKLLHDALFPQPPAVP
jgi:hypothetical protein